MRKLLIATSAEDMRRMQHAWDEAASQGPPTIFQSFAWNRLAASIFASSHAPLVVMAQSDSGIAIIPACIESLNRRISLLGEELFDYRDVLSVGDPTLLQHAWEPIAAFASDRGFEFGFHAWRPGEGTKWQGLPTMPFATAPYVRANELDRFHHPRLALNMRRLLRAGVVQGRHSGKDESVLQAIYSLKSRENHSLFSDPARIDMLLAMATCAGPNCEVFTLEHGSTLVAALVTYRDRNSRRFYTTYYCEAWAKYSPGLTLLHDVARDSMAEGLDCDFMTGAQTYKMRLATAEASLCRVSATLEEMRTAYMAAFAETA